MKKEEWKKILDNLNQMGYLDYGKIIPIEVIAQVFKTDLHDESLWSKWCGLKAEIEKLGYLCTSRGEKEKNMRIYELEEMPKESGNIIKNTFKKQKRTYKSMKNADTTRLSQQDRQKHWHACDRIDFVLRASKSPLAKIDY